MMSETVGLRLAILVVIVMCWLFIIHVLKNLGRTSAGHANRAVAPRHRGGRVHAASGRGIRDDDDGTSR